MLWLIGSRNQSEAGRRVVDYCMGTKPQSSGLLSKVANIFRAREGASDKGQLDAEELQRNVVNESEKNALQALIQRKRQDDLVRRREFNYLRKLRRATHSGGTLGSNPGERTSSFHNNSDFSVDDRASTLQKINAIEAHMISSWARGKVASTVVPLPDEKSAPPTASGAPVVQAPLRSKAPQAISLVAPDAAATPDELRKPNLGFTGMLSTPGAPAVNSLDAPPAVSMPIKVSPAKAPQAQSPVVKKFATSATAVPAALAAKSPIVALSATRTSPESLPESIETALHDAAIQFAEGNNGSAETALLGLLQGPGIATGTADVVASALFDLYRATGQQDGFDVVAMDYAERFGRSPAEWFSVPELLAAHVAKVTTPQTSRVTAVGQGMSWESSKVLTSESIEALRKQFSAPQVTWHVDWMHLADIAPEAAPALADLFAHWCAQPVELHWSGVDSLIRTLEAHSPGDDNSIDPLWWRLRLDALCILQRHDDFESLALDYCVLYEVSPPSWSPAACTLVQDQPTSDFGTQAEGLQSSAPDELPVLMGPFVACELVGEVIDEASDELTKLFAAGESADHLVITCALTVRLNFLAAGAVLNWVIERKSHGCQVQFVQVPRLVAVFFQLLGVERYAKILVRSN